MNYTQASSLLSKTFDAVKHQHTEEGHGFIKQHWDRYRELLTLLPAVDKNSRVLEVGASMLSTLLRKEFGCDVCVVFHELEPEWEERYRTDGIEAHPCELLRDRLPVADNSFDLIMFDEVLEHFPVDPNYFVRDLLRKLRPGGQLVLSVPNFATSEKRLMMLRGENPQDPMDKRYVYYAHHREPVMSECLALVRDNGGRVLARGWFDFDGEPTVYRTLRRCLFHLSRGRLHRFVHWAYPPTRRYIVVRATRSDAAVPRDAESITPPLSATKEFARS